MKEHLNKPHISNNSAYSASNASKSVQTYGPTCNGMYSAVSGVSAVNAVNAVNGNSKTSTTPTFNPNTMNHALMKIRQQTKGNVPPNTKKDLI